MGSQSMQQTLGHTGSTSLQDKQCINVRQLIHRRMSTAASVHTTIVTSTAKAAKSLRGLPPGVVFTKRNTHLPSHEQIHITTDPDGDQFLFPVQFPLLPLFGSVQDHG